MTRGNNQSLKGIGFMVEVAQKVPGYLDNSFGKSTTALLFKASTYPE